MKAAEEAGRQAEEAARKAGEAIPRELVRKIIGSWEFIIFLIIVLLSSIVSAVAISVGLSLMRPLG
jgi:Mn2+/Fe2+ NRAMP family transporter